MTAKSAAPERHGKDKPDAGHEPARDAAQGAGASMAVAESLPGWTPADPTRHLGPPQVVALQRTAGNRAVAGLLHAGHVSVQRAPAGTANAGAKHAGPKLEPFDSYADLINGFGELAVALINNEGRGLGSVRFGKDLSTKHRSLLWSIRTIFIDAQKGDGGSFRQAAAAWPGASSRLLDAIEEARKLGANGAALDSIRQAIASVNAKLGSARGRKDVPEADSYQDLDDTIRAIDSLVWESAKLPHAGSAGIVTEETPGRPDIVVSDGMKEIYSHYRDRITAVKVGDKASSSHRQLVETLRAALLQAGSEKAGSAYGALTTWRRLEGQLQFILQRGQHYGILNLDFGAVATRMQQTRAALDNHYAYVHGGNLQAVLTKQRAPGELKARQKVAEAMGPTAKAGLAEQTSIEDVQNALDVIQNHLVKSSRPGEWTITNGPTSLQIRDDQAVSLHALARDALTSYAAGLVKALVRAREDYDSIKRGNSSTKLRILSAIGGADDPGSFNLETARLIQWRDKTIKPLVDKGDYVGAFKAFLAEKPQVEKRVKEEADYDADLDTGYRRLATTMAVVQVALIALVPVAGEAALATAPAWAVGLTATGAGAGGAFIGEGSRQLVTGDHDAGKLASRTWQGGVIGAGAIAPAATRELGGVISAGGGGFAASGGEAIASGLVGGTQSKLSGGSFLEGAAGGSLGSIAGQGTKLLPGALQSGVPGKIVQVGVGAGVGELTSGDPLGGAVGALVPAVLTKTPTAGGGHEETTPAAPPKGAETSDAAPSGGAGKPSTPTSPDLTVPIPAIGAGGPGPSGSPGGGGGAPEAPLTGATTLPGTGIPPRTPAAPTTPVSGAETIPGTGIQPRPPAAPTGAETIPGTGIQERAPAAPAGPGTVPGHAPGPAPVPAPGAETLPATGVPERPSATATASKGSAGETAPDGLAGNRQADGGKTAPDGMAGKPRAGGGTVTSLPADQTPPAGGPAAGGDTAVSGPRIRPPDAKQRVQPGRAGPELPDIKPNSERPAGKVFEPSKEPAYRLDEVEANFERRGEDAGHDLPPGGAAEPSTPTASFPAEQPGRYSRAPQKITGGTTAKNSFVVIDSARQNRKFMFKPLSAENLVIGGQPVRIERAVERGIVEGQQGPREVAGPMVAEELGIKAPQGELVTIEGKQGVLIEWHEASSLQDLKLTDREAFRELIESEEFREAITSIDALDYLINNVDRGANWGNYLYEYTADGKLKLTPIDHALSFTSTKERADIVGFTRGLPEKYPPNLVEKLTQLDKGRAEFIEKIRPFVGDKAIEGFVFRLDIMIKDMHAKQRKAGGT